MISPRRQKSISVYVGIVGYVVMLITGDFIVGVWSKLIAELLRIAFYREVKAPDMAGLSLFFICASLITLAKELFL